MLQDARVIRYYQRITDTLVDYWNKGYRSDELRLYLEGYLASMRHSGAVESYLINQLEQEAIRFLYDSSSFMVAQPEAEPDYR
jgi:hypothetical protein